MPLISREVKSTVSGTKAVQGRIIEGSAPEDGKEFRVSDKVGERPGSTLPDRGELFEHLAESATGFAIFTTDCDGLVTSWNVGGEQLIGYEYGYLSVALNPAPGELFALLLPDMRVESFQAFLDEFVKFVGKKNFVRLITDGAAAHRSTRLEVDEQLTIEHLPPYSPELNPVERLFKELRKELKNLVFESLEAVEEAVIKAIEPFMKDGSRVKKLTFYSWLHTTPT